MLFQLITGVSAHGYFIQPSGFNSQIANKVNVPGLPCGEFAVMPTPQEMAQASTILRPGDTASVVWVVENNDGAGPMNIQFDPTGTGQFSGAGSQGNCTITQQVPGQLGLTKGFRVKRTPFELTFVVPQDLNCPNGCLMRISQADRQFGACAAIRTGQQYVMPPAEKQFTPRELNKLKRDKQQFVLARKQAQAQNPTPAPVAVAVITQAAQADRVHATARLENYDRIKDLEDREMPTQVAGAPIPSPSVYTQVVTVSQAPVPSPSAPAPSPVVPAPSASVSAVVSQVPVVSSASAVVSSETTIATSSPLPVVDNGSGYPSAPAPSSTSNPLIASSSETMFSLLWALLYICQ